MISWKLIIFGLVSMVAGAYLSYFINKRTNKELLNSIKAELEKLKNKG